MGIHTRDTRIVTLQYLNDFTYLGILVQRNESLRDEIKSIHSTSAMYESKHADQLEKYNSCMKAVSEVN